MRLVFVGGNDPGHGGLFGINMEDYDLMIGRGVGQVEIDLDTECHALSSIF